MLHRIALLAIAAPRRVIAAAVLVMLAAGIIGVPVANSLSSSGFQDPSSESARATQLLTDKFGQGDLQMLITVTAPDSATGPAARTVGLSIVDQLRRATNIAGVTSAWTVPAPEAKDLVSKDGRTGLIVAGLSGGESVAQNSAQTLSEEVARDHPVGAAGVIVRSGGVATVNAQITSQLQHDLLLMESIAVPLSFLLLVWVFGGLLAAALPVAVGLMAILGSMAVLRFITFGTDVSNLAPNLSTAMGLALAIDYTLLIISRYRDELAEGADPNLALIRTMTTAGRTVLVSATTVALSMAAMILFPMHVLKSFAYAGVATVAFAALAAVVVTPAAIALLGDRLNALDARRFARRLLQRPEPRTTSDRNAVLVPVNDVRHAPCPAARPGRCRIAPGTRRTLPRGEVGIPRRPCAAGVGVVASGRRPVAQRLRRQLGHFGHRGDPRRGRPHTGRSGALRR